MVLSIKVRKKEKKNYFIFSVMTEMTAGCGAVPKCKEKKSRTNFCHCYVGIQWYRDFAMKFSDQCFLCSLFCQSYNNVIAALRLVVPIPSSRWPPFPCFSSAGFLVDAAFLCAILCTIKTLMLASNLKWNILPLSVLAVWLYYRKLFLYYAPVSPHAGMTFFLPHLLAVAHNGAFSLIFIFCCTDFFF